MPSLIRDHGGFTLVELMVVVVIIGILVSVGLLVYGGVQQTARDTADEANIRTLNSATLQWMMQDENNDPRTTTTEELREILEGQYIASWPESPNDYAYVLEDGVWKVQ